MAYCILPQSFPGARAGGLKGVVVCLMPSIAENVTGEARLLWKISSLVTSARTSFAQLWRGVVGWIHTSYEWRHADSHDVADEK